MGRLLITLIITGACPFLRNGQTLGFFFFFFNYGGGCMVKLCIYSFILLSLPPYCRKCGVKDLIMYAYCIVFPSVLKKGGSRIKGAVQECISLSPCGKNGGKFERVIPGLFSWYHFSPYPPGTCSVMFDLGVVCRVLLCDRIVGSLGWGAVCMLRSALRWGFDALSSFSDSLIFQHRTVSQ